MIQTDELMLAKPDASLLAEYDIAVIVPCYNEEIAIAGVVRDFRAALPNAVVYVYDNNSTDRTMEVARMSGAVVRREPRQGKGHVVKRMFADIDADIYVLVDGDGTYDAASAGAMIGRLVTEGLDMVVGVRVDCEEAAYRLGHLSSHRQSPAHRIGSCSVRAHVFRHAVGISHIYTTFCQILSGAVGRFRDRD